MICNNRKPIFDLESFSQNGATTFSITTLNITAKNKTLSTIFSLKTLGIMVLSIGTLNTIFSIMTI